MKIILKKFTILKPKISIAVGIKAYKSQDISNETASVGASVPYLYGINSGIYGSSTIIEEV